MPDAITRRIARTALLLGLVAAPFAAGAPAGAIGNGFSMAPASGPSGTVVAVSGTGCAPGLLLSSTLDYVQVTVTTSPPVSVRLAAAANGSWHGSFTVPANATATPALVSTLCVSGGLQSLLTLYAPKTFTVTAVGSVSPPPTAPTTPPTTAPRGPAGPTPTTTVRRPPTSTTHTTPTTTPRDNATPPTDGSVAPTLPAASPGPIIRDGTPPGAAHGRLGSNAATAKKTAARGVYAADLSAPGAVGVDTPDGSGGLGWLLWLLLAGALLLVLAPFGRRRLHGYFRRSG